MDADADSCASCEACEESLPISGAGHVEGDVTYPDPPPSSGDHNPCWADWGVHSDELPDERWVHNLEHGGVVYLYNCPEGCMKEVNAMAQLVLGRERALLTPYARLPKRFAVVSWGQRLLSDCFDRAVFDAFYEQHVGRGPEDLSDYPPVGCHTE